jgi:hypothetical protein
MSDVREHEDNERTVDRRRLLRRAGTVAAGVAGAGVVTAVAAGPAEAAPGDPVVQGQENNAAATTTAISNSSPTNPTLALANGSVDADAGVGPALQLVPGDGGFLALTAPAGSLAADVDGVVWSAVDFGTGSIPVFLYSPATANFTLPLAVPTRVLDTRTAAGRANLISPGSNIDGAGRVKAGATVNLNLSSFLNVAWAVMGNLTAVTPSGGGFITMFAAGNARPTASSLNYNGTTLSNFTFSAIGGDPNSATQHDVLSIYCHTTTHVIFDMVAVVVQDYSQVASSVSSMSSGSAGLLSAQAVERQKVALQRLRAAK